MCVEGPYIEAVTLWSKATKPTVYSMSMMFFPDHFTCLLPQPRTKDKCTPPEVI